MKYLQQLKIRQLISMWLTLITHVYFDYNSILILIEWCFERKLNLDAHVFDYGFEKILMTMIISFDELVLLIAQNRYRWHKSHSYFCLFPSNKSTKTRKRCCNLKKWFVSTISMNWIYLFEEVIDSKCTVSK